MGLPPAAEAPRIGKAGTALTVNVAQRRTHAEEGFLQNRGASFKRNLANVAKNILAQNRALLEMDVLANKVRMIRALPPLTREWHTQDTACDGSVGSCKDRSALCAQSNGIGIASDGNLDHDARGKCVRSDVDVYAYVGAYLYYDVFSDTGTSFLECSSNDSTEFLDGISPWSSVGPAV